MIFKQLREFFIFTRRERNGLLVLITILFLTICLDIAIPFILPVKEYDVSKWKEETDRYYAAEPIREEPLKEDPAKELYMRDLDPNKVGQADLINLGVPPRIAANWIKYLQKGGRFKKKEEVMKLYGMSTQLYNSLEEFLVIPENRSFIKSY